MIDELGIFFSHDERWPIFILLGVAIFCMVRAAIFRRQALQKLGLLKKEGAFEKPIYRVVKQILYGLGTAFCIVAAMGPQWGQKAQAIKAQGLDICFAIDLSRSMLAEDIAPSRLKQAKNQLSIFLPRLGGDRAAIAAFAGTGYVAAPLSIDHAALTQFLDPLEPEFISDQSTNLGAGVDACLTALDLDKVKDRNEILDLAAKLIVLISDGEDTVEDYKDAIARAEKLGIPVYAMAMGTAKGGPIAIRDAEGRLKEYLKDPATGQPGLSKLEDKALKEIAKRTGGKVFYASEGIEAWKQFESGIANYKRDSRDAGTRMDREERFQWPLLMAFVLLLLDFFLTETKMKIGFLIFLLLLPLSSRAQDLGAIYFNKKGYSAFTQKDLPGAQGQYSEALGRDASDPKTRFNWATTKLFSAANPPTGKEKDAKAQVNKKAVDEAVKELEELKKDPRSVGNFKKGLEYQLGQAYELGSDTTKALQHYYASLSHDKNPDFDKKIQGNISRLLTQQEQGGGGGGGGSDNKDDKGGGGKDQNKGDGDKEKKNPQYGDQPQQQKPKYSGTEVSEDQAKQILESVSGEESEVLKRRAKDEAKERARHKTGEKGDAGGSNAKPW